MWKTKTKMLPMIIGANSAISVTFRKYLINVPEKREIRELHKTIILAAARAHTHTHTHTHIRK